MFAPIGSGRPAGHRRREIRKGRNVRFPDASANRGAARQRLVADSLGRHGQAYATAAAVASGRRRVPLSGKPVRAAVALARVLRMLIDHVTECGRREHVPSLRRQLRLLVDGVSAEPGLHPEDLQRFLAVAESTVDPAERDTSN